MEENILDLESIENGSGNNGNNSGSGNAEAGNNGNGGNNSISFDGANARTVRSESGESGNGSTGNRTDGGASASDGGNESGSELRNFDGVGESTLGNEQPIQQLRNDADGDGRKRRRRRNGGNRVAADSGNADSRNAEKQLEETILLDAEKKPRKVSKKVFGEDQDGIANLTKNEMIQIISNTIQFAFYGLSKFFGQSFWEIDDKEAVECGKAVYDVINSQGVKSKKQFEKLLKEYAPYFKLVMSLGAVIWTRAIIQIEVSKENKKVNQNERVNTVTTSGANAEAGNFGVPSWSDVSFRSN